ncbi:hypothetical protein R1sor_005309 [Riccia sorocarpa]|uniref:Protein DETOXIFICATION n=1 Tax=Riccia sorocarpa TaxID=122646 RepID=A0ABD3HJN6_9MARC
MASLCCACPSIDNYSTAPTISTTAKAVHHLSAGFHVTDRSRSRTLAMPVATSLQAPCSPAACAALDVVDFPLLPDNVFVGSVTYSLQQNRDRDALEMTMFFCLLAASRRGAETGPVGVTCPHPSSAARVNSSVCVSRRNGVQDRLHLRNRRSRRLSGSETVKLWRFHDINPVRLFTPIENFEGGARTVSMSLSSGPESPSSAPLTETDKKLSISGLFDGFWGSFRADELGKEIGVIALPALLALAADPLASLVDTAFIGRIGAVDLAAVGVSISIFNLVSKMFNLPLLNITTSFVAEDEAAAKDVSLDVPEEELESGSLLTTMEDEEIELLRPTEMYVPKSSKPLLPSVSSALVVGTALGVMETAVLTVGAGPILSAMGVGVGSSMRTPALQYLALRAIGAPAVVVSLATQGIFRGFKDTRTPLIATVLSNVLNIILCPTLMFVFNWGVVGAAIATVISQYLMALILLWILNSRVTLLPPNLADLRFDRFLKSGGLLLGRTLANLFTMTLATSMAARLGAVPMAAHQICAQVWLAASLLSDSLALAGQAIIASAFAKEDYRRVKLVSLRIMQMGIGFGLFMALLLGMGSAWFTRVFTNDVAVRETMTFILPFVIFTQPINSLAFVFDGIFYGVSDFSFAAYSMILVAIPSSIALLSLPPLWGIVGVWTGLTLLMTLRAAAGFYRITRSSGPWSKPDEDYGTSMLETDPKDSSSPY